MHHVILGAGPAGVIAAETIRKHQPLDAITLVGDEKEPPYSRMAIPYLLMGNIAGVGDLVAQGPGSLRGDCGSRWCKRAPPAVDPSPGRVALDSGEQLRFDTLLIATGSTPVRPPIPGIDLPGVHPCWTLDDARKIMGLAVKGARVLQMGAGFIGCIIMEALSARGVHLSVVEMGDRMVPRMMGADGRRHDQGVVRGQGRGGFHRHPGRGHRGRNAAVGAAVERPAGGGRPRDQRHRRQAEHRFPRELRHHLPAGRADRRAHADQCSRHLCGRGLRRSFRQDQRPDHRQRDPAERVGPGAGRRAQHGRTARGS